MAKPSPTHANDPSLVALGATIRSTRTALNMSQEALALAADLDRSYMGGIERGEHNIALINIIKIASALKLKASDLLTASSLWAQLRNKRFSHNVRSECSGLANRYINLLIRHQLSNNLYLTFGVL